MSEPPFEAGRAEFPPDSELVFGLVGAVGVDLGAVARGLIAELARFRYRGVDIHLTDSFDAFDFSEGLVDDPYDERLWSYMSAGDELRERWGRRDAMALLAINRIALERSILTGSESVPSDRAAYVLRSFKRPEEIKLLREIYGSRFLLVGVAATEALRLDYLQRRIAETRLPPHPLAAEHPPSELIERDQREERVAHGQDVRDTFHRADCFVEVDGTEQEQVARVLDIFFGDPTRSPRKEEFGMFQAVAAARRSAELGRQVGAAVCTADGDVVAVGVNEVPKPGGGLYWEGDDPDAREIMLGSDSNRARRQEIAADIAARLEGANLLSPQAPIEDVLASVEASALGDVIEFIRAVHAEMAALMDAARRGVSVDRCTLYVTTFPCHHCARHIVAAGIRRVVFIAPYAKSRAADLHSDALLIGRGASHDPRVPFESFVGVGPLRYLDWFEYPERKENDGRLRAFNPVSADARLPDRDPVELRSDRLPYLDREHRASVLLRECEARSGLALRRPEPGASDAVAS